MVAGVPRRLHQLVDDVLRRGLVGVAHAEIDDVLPSRSRLGLEIVDDAEDVGRQPLDPVEVVHGRSSVGHMILSRLWNCQRTKAVTAAVGGGYGVDTDFRRVLQPPETGKPVPRLSRTLHIGRTISHGATHLASGRTGRGDDDMTRHVGGAWRTTR